MNAAPDPSLDWVVSTEEGLSRPIDTDMAVLDRAAASDPQRVGGEDCVRLERARRIGAQTSIWAPFANPGVESLFIAISVDVYAGDDAAEQSLAPLVLALGTVD